MRILQINNFYSIGGTERVISIIKKGFLEKGFEVFGLYGEKSPDNQRDFYIPEIDDAKNLKAIQEIVRKISPNIIFVHNIFNPKLINFLSSQKSIRFVHDVRLFCPINTKRNRDKSICHRPLNTSCLIGMLSKKCCSYRNPLNPLRFYNNRLDEFLAAKKFKYFVVDSDYIKHQLRSNKIKNKIFKLSPPSIFTPQRKKKFGNHKLLFVGRSDPIKGINFLLDSIKLLKKEVSCTLIGISKEEADLVKNYIKKLGIEKRIKIVNKANDKEMTKYYKEADVFVFPSLCVESLGLTGVEAISFGLPCVGIDALGNREWLHDKENGFLVKFVNPKEFSLKINKLINNNNLMKEFSANSLKIAKKFNRPDYINDLVNLIQNLK